MSTLKTVILGLMIFATSLVAEVSNIPATLKFLKENKMKIIDIRTQGEWVQMGIIKDAHLLTFFNGKGQYDVKKFLKDLNKIVNKDEKFALICNTGSRTKLVSNFLGNKHDYKVVNLTGGMANLLHEGFKVEVYIPEENNTTK